MRYSATIDVPNLDKGIHFYCSVFGLTESARPINTYAVLKCGDTQLGILEKAPGTKPAPNSNDVRTYNRHWTPVHIDFHVANFEETLQLAQQEGAIIEQKFEGGDHSRIAFCSDPFGNGFCITEK